MCHGSTNGYRNGADDDPAASSFDLCSLQAGDAVVSCEETSPAFLSFLPFFLPSVRQSNARPTQQFSAFFFFFNN